MIFTLLLGGLASAQWKVPKPGESYSSVSYDLNNDGSKEKIVLSAYNIEPRADSFYGRLRVLDAKGKAIWEGPKPTSSDGLLAFGRWPYGASELDWIGDLDGDRKADLLSAEPVSDVRPTTWRRFRWTGKAFEKMPSKMLLESPLGSGHYAWADPVDWDGVTPLTWVMNLTGTPMVAKVFSVNGDKYLDGKVRFVPDGNGYKIGSWMKPMGVPQ